ncbi:MAG: haloacid dehalogenase-like hydrolase [Krumholzibacteria bacterium]|nr:haloacid dehalogenase-like hydrolase [Candidatus Krumholzibacteria bacterium]
MRTFRLSIVLLAVLAAAAAAAADPLPSWHDRPVKAAILGWLAAVTDTTGPDHIPVPERIAVFDNDGTSWCERPGYGPTDFQVDLARSLAARGQIDPEAMPFKAWFADDRDALRAFGWNEAYVRMNAAFAGMPVEAYRDSARAWLARTVHERFGVTHDRLYYPPMLELMRLLEAHAFQVWIVSGGAQDFVRSYSEEVIGIPPERVIGSWTMPVYRRNDDGTVTMVRGDTQTYNGHEHKPANIEARIGRRPVFAAGNSNNDEPMSRYAVTGPRRGLAIWIHHDDGEREYAYGRPGRLGELCAEHPAAHEVSMDRDWVRVFADGIGR